MRAGVWAGLGWDGGWAGMGCGLGWGWCEEVGKSQVLDRDGLGGFLRLETTLAPTCGTVLVKGSVLFSFLSFLWCMWGRDGAHE